MREHAKGRIGEKRRRDTDSSSPDRPDRHHKRRPPSYKEAMRRKRQSEDAKARNALRHGGQGGQGQCQGSNARPSPAWQANQAQSVSPAEMQAPLAQLQLQQAQLQLQIAGLQQNQPCHKLAGNKSCMAGNKSCMAGTKSCNVAGTNATANSPPRDLLESASPCC